MTFPGFSAIAYVWLFALLVPLIVFYFLKLKRPRVDIPSLALWRQVIQDQRVNSPFQKFKRNILLLLQILLLSFLALAAMQPFWPAAAEQAQYIPVLIDCSASMGAREKAGGPTRLDLAKDEVNRLIDNLLPSQRLALIAFHGSAERVTDFTDNRQILRTALSGLQVVDVPSRTEDGLRLAQAMARTVAVSKVILFSDGNLPAEVDFELPFELQFQRLPGGGPNLGVTALNAQRSGASDWEVFVRVEASAPTGASSKTPLSTGVILQQDGVTTSEDRVTLDPGGAKRLVFKVDGAKASRVEVRLQPEEFDAVLADDMAFLELPATRPLTVYAHPDMTVYRHALEALEGIVLYPDDSGEGSLPEYDLVITNDLAGLPEAPLVWTVGAIPPELRDLVTIENTPTSVVDWQRGAAVLQHVLLSEITISTEPKNADEVGDAEYEQLGYEILVHGRQGPLLLQKRDGARVSYHLLFDSDASTLPYRVGFPILVSNLVTEARTQSGLAEIRAPATGVLPALSAPAEQEVAVRGPDGRTGTYRASSAGQLTGVSAQRAGWYQVGGAPERQIGVSLLSAEETSLASVGELRLKDLTVASSESKVESDQPLWRPLALIAFGLLIGEWWFYQRRPTGAR